MRKIISSITLLSLLVACNTELEIMYPNESGDIVSNIPIDATSGEVIIKFSAEMEDILESTMTRSGGSATRSGIPSTDEVLDILGAYSFEPVFPTDPRHEARTREAGLHLWYIVRFDEGENLEVAMQRLSQLGE